MRENTARNTCQTCNRDLPKRAQHKRQCATCQKRTAGREVVAYGQWLSKRKLARLAKRTPAA